MYKMIIRFDDAVQPRMIWRLISVVPGSARTYLYLLESLLRPNPLSDPLLFSLLDRKAPFAPVVPRWILGASGHLFCAHSGC